MSLFSNLKEAISADINNEISSRVRPDTMAEYYAGKAREELNASRNRTAAVMVDRQLLEEDIQSIEQDIQKLDSLAEKAMLAGDEGSAKRVVEKKVFLNRKLESMKKALEAARKSEETALSAYDEQRKETDSMDYELAQIRANVAEADAKTATMSYISGMSDRAASKFHDMKKRTRRMVAEADARREVEQRGSGTIDDIVEKYSNDIDAVCHEMNVLKERCMAKA